MQQNRKRSIYFLLASIVEHVFIIALVAALIYSEPSDIAEKQDSIVVSLEEMKIKEPEPRLKLVVQKKKKEPAKKNEVVKKEVKADLPIVPKLKIQDTTSLGSDIPLQLPTTVAKVSDFGSDAILKSSNIESRKPKVSDIETSIGVETHFKSSKRPSVSSVSPPSAQQGKGKSDTSKAAEPGYATGKNPSFSERSGPLSDVARPGFVGDIKGEIAGRRVIAWPPLPGELSGTQGGSATLEIVVDPSGNVTKVRITKKSGSPRLDRVAMDYVEQIRFEALPKNVQQKTQKGEILINFELAKGA